MSEAAAAVLGKCPCPVCKTPEQEVRASKKGKAYIMCDECDVQVFSRSTRSHKRLLEYVKATGAPAPAPKPAPAPAPGKPDPAPAKGANNVW